MIDSKEVETRYGRFRLPNTGDLIARALETYGEWAQDELNLLAHFLSPGDVVYDIGAFIGTHSRAFSQIVGPEGMVYAFEASPKNYEVLLANIALGPNANVETINKAVGSQDRITFVINPDDRNAGAKFVRSSKSDAGAESERSEEIRLDGSDFPAPKLMKIDVEGAELQVLAGAEALIRKAHPIIFAEANSIEGSADVLRFCTALDYLVFGVNMPAFRSDNFNKSANDIFNGGTECGLLMVPVPVASINKSFLSHLAPVTTLDDIALLLLNKPQYAHGYLRELASTPVLGLPTINVGALKNQDRLSMPEARQGEQKNASNQLEEQYRKFKADKKRLEADQKKLEAEFRASEKDLAARRAVERRLNGELNAARAERRRLNLELATSRDDCHQLQLRIDALEDVRRHAQVLAKAVCKPPFSAYFKRRGKYRRILSMVTGSLSIATCEPKEYAKNSYEYNLVKEHFDPDYYRARYDREVAATDDLVSHYLNTGWHLGWDPTPRFSTKFYLRNNPKLLELGVNPFVHFLETGCFENGIGKHPAGYRGETLGDLTMLEPSSVLGPTSDVTIEAPADILSSLIGKGGEAPRLLVSVSHDDYTTVVGGTQFCIEREAAAAQDAGIDYLNLHPTTALRTLASPSDFEGLELTAVLNGEKVGNTTYGALRESLARFARRGGVTNFVFHQMLGHSPEGLLALAEAAGERDCWLWAHDFFSLCPNYNLLRNGVSFCGAPALDSAACGICASGKVRRDHLARMHALFDGLNVHVLSPSQVTADFWSSRAPFRPSRVDVAPHVSLGWEDRTRPLTRALNPGGPLRIGYLGAPLPHKGWELFTQLFSEFHSDLAIEFVYLGSYDITEAMEVHPVNVTLETPTAMIEAIEEAGLDLVVHFAVWPETFSFTTFEALAGGAGVITNPGSGNVAAIVADTGLGAVLDDYAALSEFVRSGAALEMAMKLRQRRGELQATYKLSDMVIPFLREKVAP